MQIYFSMKVSNELKNNDLLTMLIISYEMNTILKDHRIKEKRPLSWLTGDLKVA